jgi:uncharacterized protein
LTPPGLDGPVYVDTSGLVKLYLPEKDSAAVDRAVAGRRDLLVSDLAVTELVSSLCRRRREGDLSTSQISRVHRAVLGHVASGALRRIDVSETTFREAERLLTTLVDVPLRAADALHLAGAVEADAATLLTFDERLSTAAARVGLAVWPAPRRRKEPHS